MVVFAKSNPIENPESLFAHTNTVLKEAECLKNSYGSGILAAVPECYRPFFWDALYLAIKAHDLGKVQTLFQNKILKACKRNTLDPIKGIAEIPHNIISPAFIYNHVKAFPEELRPAIYQAIAFHHSRGKEWLDDSKWPFEIRDVIEKDVTSRMPELEDMQPLFDSKLPIPSFSYLRKLQVPLRGDMAVFYILLKGCLHRADHSGSAHLEAEIHPHAYSPQQVTDYLQNRGVPLKNIWQISVADSALDQNVVFQAGTGSGKTEFALYWIGKEKAFYTLPMRTSVNAMYERLKKTYNSANIGLLHSDSIIYALSSTGLFPGTGFEDNGIHETLHRMYASKQLSMPISVSTADQIFTSAFKYEGYQKVFATLAYSRLVVDEIQSYDPDIVAIILRMLVDLSKIGCKFCIITATLPNMYLDYLKANVAGIANLPPKFKADIRHRVRPLNKSIEEPETIDLIVKLNKKYGNVLVITNTVKMAKRVKTLLLERNVCAPLLHSMFTYEDRNSKEQILTTLKNGLDFKKGIWITTQIAEVSLDIDFDVMVTEISSIDSQVQRWGRVWRARESSYAGKEPNIYVTSPPSDDGHIYDEVLVALTNKILCHNDSSPLSDQKEYNLVQKVFDSRVIRNSKYKGKFDTSMRMLEEHDFSVDTKGEAQRLFRRISNINVIPSRVYDDNQGVIDQAVNDLDLPDSLKRQFALLAIRKKTVAVPFHYLKDIRYRSLNDKYEIIVAGME